MKYVILACLWVVALTQNNGTIDLFCFGGENANKGIVIFILSNNGTGWIQCWRAMNIIFTL
jgi:hypothetical protein